jgi:hypothetical protein
MQGLVARWTERDFNAGGVDHNVPNYIRRHWGSRGAWERDTFCVAGGVTLLLQLSRNVFSNDQSDNDDNSSFHHDISPFGDARDLDPGEVESQYAPVWNDALVL